MLAFGDCLHLVIFGLVVFCCLVCCVVRFFGLFDVGYCVVWILRVRDFVTIWFDLLGLKLVGVPVDCGLQIACLVCLGVFWWGWFTCFALLD